MPAWLRRTVVIAGILVSIAGIDLPGQITTTAFTNGLWFDGTTFVPRTAVVAANVLSFPGLAEGLPTDAVTVDLAGGYALPPLCDAHNHNVGVGRPEERNRRYLNAGVFYVGSLNDAPQLAEAEAAFWNRADTIDIAWAHGGITGRGGHPVELLEGIRRSGGYPAGTVLPDFAYSELDDARELDTKWPSIIRYKPDFVKVFLQFSLEHDRRRADPLFFGNRGVSPSVFRSVVQRAQREGFRVAAHVVSAADFRLAVSEGVDIIAHLPGFMDEQRILPEDAELAASKRVTVITTTALAASFARRAGPGRLE